MIKIEYYDEENNVHINLIKEDNNIKISLEHNIFTIIGNIPIENIKNLLNER